MLENQAYVAGAGEEVAAAGLGCLGASAADFAAVASLCLGSEGPESCAPWSREGTDSVPEDFALVGLAGSRPGIRGSCLCPTVP